MDRITGWVGSGVRMNRATDILAVAGSLIVIVLIMVAAYYATRWYAKRSGPAYGGKYIRVVDRAMLGNNSSLVIAEVEGRYYLLGVSERNIQFLCELDAVHEEEAAQAAGMSFGGMLQSMLRRDKQNGAESTGDHGPDGGDPS